ncbi:hypothetical protein V6N12_073474 [Hibiscus sabdariffa]|uniref:Uncharacterized protein n=1 Tax=Hibiscus sabdariffa TaxID=183260 RepID=A0ABR2ALD4_9ROSI
MTKILLLLVGELNPTPGIEEGVESGEAYKEGAGCSVATYLPGTMTSIARGRGAALRVANSLANRGHSLNMASTIFYLAPEDIVALVVEEQRKGSEAVVLEVRNTPVLQVARYGIG